MKKNLSFYYEFIEEPGKDLFKIGQTLANNIIKQAKDDPLDFKLLIFYATPEFKNFEDILKGIRSISHNNVKLDSIPLVGCSVAGCITNIGIYEQGAMLVGILSDDEFNVQVAIGEQCSNGPTEAIEYITTSLGLNDFNFDSEHDHKRTALMLLPGFKKTIKKPPRYNDPTMHQLFCKKTKYCIPTVGGSSSAGFQKPGNGWQFFNSDVYQDTAVVVLLEHNIQTGYSMGAGLKSTKGYVRINNLREDHKTFSLDDITGEKEDLDLLKRTNLRGIVFGKKNEERDLSILYPSNNKNGTFSFMREIDGHEDYEILEADKNRSKATALEEFNKSYSNAGLRIEDVAGSLGFFCSARYKLFGDDDNWKNVAHRKLVNGLNNIPYAAVYVAGEFGLDNTGLPTLNNLQISNITFGQYLTRKAQLRKGYKSLTEASKKMIDAQNVEMTIQAALDGLEQAGFTGGMISQVNEQNTHGITSTKWLVAKNAISNRWKSIVEDTIREFGSDDILERVCNTGKHLYIPDSRKNQHCDKDSIRKAGIISQFIAPLIIEADVEPKRTFGTLQVDLDDISHIEELPKDLKGFLYSYSNQVSSALSKAILNENLSLERRIEKVITEGLNSKNPKDVTDIFLSALLEEIGAKDCHIRLLSSDKKHLRILSKKGIYADIACDNGREIITVDDYGPSAYCFRKCSIDKPMVINNAEDHDSAFNLRVQYPPETPLGEALRTHGSFFNIPLINMNNANNKLGILSIGDTKKWFFSQYKIEFIIYAAKRLSFLINLLLRTRDIEILKAAVPKLENPGSLEEKLELLAKNLKENFKSDIVSIFIWKKEYKALILGAKCGWNDSSFTNAYYTRIDRHRITYSMVDKENPHFIKDRRDKNKSKYENEMFGVIPKDMTYEMIAFPIHEYDKTLGVITLYNKIKQTDVDKSHFSTTEDHILKQVQKGLSTYIYSLKVFDELSKQKEDEEFFVQISNTFTKDLPLKTTLQMLLNDLKNKIDVEAIGIYTKESGDENTLRLMTSTGYPESLSYSLVRLKNRNSAEMAAFINNETVSYVKNMLHQTINIENKKKFIEYFKSKDIHSFLAIPIVFKEEKIGIISFFNFASLTKSIDYGIDTIPSSILSFLNRLVSMIAGYMNIRWIQEQSMLTKRHMDRVAIESIKIAHPFFNDLHQVTSICQTMYAYTNKTIIREKFDEIRDITSKVTTKIVEFKDVIKGLRHRHIRWHRVSTIINNALNEYINTPGINIKFDLTNDFEAELCESEIIEILTILLDNAIHASKQGGQITIEMRYLNKSQTGVVSIRNSGDKLSKEQWNLSTTSWQTGLFHSNKLNGNGLGIPIAYILALSNYCELKYISNSSCTEIALEMSAVQLEK